MASGLLMSAPVCLIENSNGQFMVNQDALQVLTTVTQPVVVVAIVGLYRTGKSYLMNKLAGQNTGFSLGSTVQSHTKGIWMWCVPHPKEPNHTLILLDTEGLGDVEKGDNKNDTWIFALAVLLSSTFVYNSMGTISQQTMDQLHYVTELTDKIKAKSSPSTEQMNDSMEFASLFPDFVWTVRDFILELEIDGQPITSDQYLENALKLKKGTSEEARICIQKFFPNRKCFIFVPPAHRKKLKQLEELHDDELDIDFVENTKNFCDYIFKNAKAKTLPGGGTVNGFRLGKLVLNYVEAITSGDIPCMENAVLALAQLENSAAVQRSLTLYEEMMRQKVRFPTETLQELLDAHIVCKSEATKSFIKDSFKDVNQEFQKTLEADKTLEEYLKSKETVADAINQTDKMLTAKEEEKKEQQRKAQVAADAARALEIQQRRQEQIRLENERRQQEQLRQMAANIGAQRRQWLAEQEREQARRLQEQAQLLQEQQRREIAEQQRQIQILLAQHHNCNSDNDCIIL
ncbi:guanylate-binding protein 1-like isoform X2 [Phascolarctos cinereus]|uniref:Guanylate-binding protein 1-like isoform X2 n=1 Tax=Phascolarctos cinereus TaxID=38626 RepID=A0A6P5KIK8_PHACI|nr:guanylate-binding protein 1-like isoform X2 [Phascolarctos cinereus]